MGSAWNYSAKECSADDKFSAEFEGHEIAMDAPSLGELRLYASAEAQGLNLKRKESDSKSKQATVCFTFSDDSRFLAFAQ